MPKKKALFVFGLLHANETKRKICEEAFLLFLI